MEYLLFFFSFFCLIFLLIKFKLKIANKLNLVDFQEISRKKNSNDGLLLNGFVSLFVFFPNYIYKSFETYDVLISLLYFSFFLIGLLDDMKKMTIKLRSIFYLLVPIIFLLFEKNFFNNFYINYIEIFGFSLDMNNLIYITILSIGIFCLFNVLNFYDGIDYNLIIFIIIFNTYLLYKSNFSNSFYLIILFVLFVMLILNKKNFFLGSSGVGIFCIYIFLTSKHNYQIGLLSLEELILLLGIPIIDSLRVIFYRTLVLKRSPIVADRNHLHHLLCDNINQKMANILMAGIVTLPIIFKIYFIIDWNLAFIFLLMTYSSMFLFIYLKIKNEKKL